MWIKADPDCLKLPSIRLSLQANRVLRLASLESDRREPIYKISRWHTEEETNVVVSHWYDEPSERLTNLFDDIPPATILIKSLRNVRFAVEMLEPEAHLEAILLYCCLVDPFCLVKLILVAEGGIVSASHQTTLKQKNHIPQNIVTLFVFRQTITQDVHSAAQLSEEVAAGVSTSEGVLQLLLLSAHQK